MKKKISTILIVLLLSTLFTASAFAEERDIRVVLDGKTIHFSPTDGKPTIVNNRTMLPFRKIGETLPNTEIEWLADARQVKATRGEKRALLTIGKHEYGVNNEVKTTDTPPTIINNRTYVPVRVLSESLGLAVVWKEVDGVGLVFQFSLNQDPAEQERIMNDYIKNEFKAPIRKEGLLPVTPSGEHNTVNLEAKPAYPLEGWEKDFVKEVASKIQNHGYELNPENIGVSFLKNGRFDAELYKWNGFYVLEFETERTDENLIKDLINVYFYGSEEVYKNCKRLVPYSRRVTYNVNGNQVEVFWTDNVNVRISTPIH